MAEPLYTRDILRLAMQLAELPELDSPDGRGTARARICGSQMDAAITLGKGQRAEIVAITAKACAFGQASAAILQSKAKGLSCEDLTLLRSEVANWLASSGELPQDFSELEVLAPALAHHARHPAILLPYDALLAAFADAEKKAAA